MCLSLISCRLIQPVFHFNAFVLCIKRNGRFLCEFSLIVLDCLFFRQRGILGCESETCFKLKATNLPVEEISTVIYAKQILLLYLWGKNILQCLLKNVYPENICTIFADMNIYGNRVLYKTTLCVVLFSSGKQSLIIFPLFLPARKHKNSSRLALQIAVKVRIWSITFLPL